MLDETSTAKEAVHCINRFSSASCKDECGAGVHEVSEVNLSVVSHKIRGQSNKDRRLTVGTWNFAGLCSERKERE